MKIKYKLGDALGGPEKYLAHGCNNKGVMGSGIAKQIRENYTKAYDYYRWTHQRSGLKLGEVYAIDCGGKVIFNCITQNGFGRDGEKYVCYDAIKQCIIEISNSVEDEYPVAMPRIGAGLGGGDWSTIEKIIEENSTFQPVVYDL